MSKPLLLALVLASLVSTPGMAATPEAFAERAKVVAAGNQLHLYRLPTIDVDGDVRYLDATVTLGVANGGRLNKNAKVATRNSPPVESTDFVGGDYRAGGMLCRVDVAPYEGSDRIEILLHCEKDGSPGVTVDATLYTGALAGHRYEAELIAADITTIAAAGNLAWGIPLSAPGGANFSGCDLDVAADEALSARQVADTLTLVRYEKGRAVCGVILLAATP